MKRDERQFWARVVAWGERRERREQWQEEQQAKQAQYEARQRQQPPKAERPLCGAKTRAGGTCKARALTFSERCRMHGGLSTGPRTEAGRARIAQSNRRRGMLRRGMTPEEVEAVFQEEAEQARREMERQRAKQAAEQERERRGLLAEMARRLRAYEWLHGVVTPATKEEANRKGQRSERQQYPIFKRYLIDAGMWDDKAEW